MKNLAICKDLNIGDEVSNISNGNICSTYPLTDFKNYSSQERDNQIKNGRIIDITPHTAILKTILVENNGKVCCVRVY